MNSLKKNKFIIAIGIALVVLFAVIMIFVFSATATQKAVVFATDQKAGTTITEEMLTTIEVPKNADLGDYCKDANKLVGEKLGSNVNKKQLVYASSLASNLTLSSDEEHDDFITTSISVPDEYSLNGMLSAGDKIDISVVPSDNTSLAKLLPGYGISTDVTGGSYFILSNVKIVDSTSAVSSNQGSTVNSVNESAGNSGGSSSGSTTFFVSLNYEDFKKLMIAEQYGQLVVTMCPAQNDDDDAYPLLEEMAKTTIDTGLTNASKAINDEDRDTSAVKESDNSSSSNSSSSSSSNSSSSSSSSSNN